MHGGAAAGLPFTEEVKGECAENRTELAALAVDILIDNHVDLEHFAKRIPEVCRSREPPVVE